jgi:hypothetical protein
MNWRRYAARMGRRGMYIGYWLKKQKERSTSKPRCEWVDTIKINLIG